MKKPLSFSFSNGQTAHAVQVDDFVNLSAALDDLGFEGSGITVPIWENRTLRN